MYSTVSNADAAHEGGAVTQYSPGEGPVVIVDDNASDALQTEEVIRELEPAFPAQILTSGEDLAAYLQGEGLYKDRGRYPYPGLVLLDLKMPKMDGFAVLEWIKEHPEHANVPIVVLSGFAGMVEQVTRAYSQGAHAFLPKPVQLDDMQSIFTLLKIPI
jgi:CheY-like chemotaxis protein